MEPLSIPSDGEGMDWDEEDLSTQIYDKPELAEEDALSTMRVSMPPPHDVHGGDDATGPGAQVAPAQATARDRTATPRHVPAPQRTATPQHVPVPPQRSATPQHVPAPPQRSATPQHVPVLARTATPRQVPAPQRGGTPQHGTAPARRPGRHTTPNLSGGSVPRQHPLRTDPPFAQLPADAATTPGTNWARRSEHSRPMWVAVGSVITIVACVIVGLMLFGQRQPGTLNLTTQPSRVSVSVDGRSLGESTSPFVIGELTAGKAHNIMVSSPGYVAWSHDLELAPGQVVTLPTVSLKRIETGFALSTEPPGATVFVDDRALPDRTPVRVADLAPGEHRIRVEYAGWSSWSNVVHVTAGTMLPLPEIQLQSLAVARTDADPSLTGRAARKGRGARSAHADPSADDTGEEDETAQNSARDRARKNEAAETPDELMPPVTAGGPDKTTRDEKPAREEKSLDDLLNTADPVAPQAQARAGSAETGTLRVNSRPWSQIFVDGKAFGTTPRFNIELPPGNHTLELVNKEFGVKRTLDVTISPGKVETLVINLNE